MLYPAYATWQNCYARFRIVGNGFARVLADTYQLSDDPYWRTGRRADARGQVIDRHWCYEYVRLPHGDAWCAVQVPGAAKHERWAVYYHPGNRTKSLDAQHALHPANRGVPPEDMVDVVPIVRFRGYVPADETTASHRHTPVLVTNLDAIDSATNEHSHTQNLLARHLSKNRLTPKLPDNGSQFDVSWIDNDILYVAEVKSLPIGGETEQLRLGLGQVLDYRYRLARHQDLQTQAVLASMFRAPSTVGGDALLI